MTWNEVMEPPGHQRSMTSYDPYDRKWFLEFLTPTNHPWAFKNHETCSTRREEHAGRWNFALAPSEAKLSAITGFRHFSALDLTSEVAGWPRTFNLYTNRFVSRRATRSFFPRSSNSIRGETARGVVSALPPCRERMRNSLCRRGLTWGFELRWSYCSSCKITP